MAGVLNSEVKKFCGASYRGRRWGSKATGLLLMNVSAQVLLLKPRPAGPASVLPRLVTVNTTASHENGETFGNTIGTFRKKG